MTVAFVTGAGGGIGRATAEAFAAAGFSVVLVDVNDEAARASALEIDPAGERALALECDVASTASVGQAFTETLSAFGRVDALAHVAGIVSPGPSESLSDEDWQRLVDIHLGGAFRCARAAFAPLSASGAGSIVNVSSIAGRAGFSNRASYCAAKAGIEGLTRALAVEWASRGIRVNAVAPGHVRTPMLDHSLAIGSVTPQTVEARTARIPLGRYAEPAEIAAAVLFLSSPAASYITGEVVCVDGATTVNADVG